MSVQVERRRRKAHAIAAAALFAALTTAAAADAAIHVDDDATGSGDGTSWADAYPSLADALAQHPLGEIWVAAGTYAPAGPGGDRAATFALRNGRALYGGFAGTEAQRDERDPVANETVLSGDLNGDDQPGWYAMEDNSYHVVTAANASASAVLDGFTITRGRATASSGLLAFGGGVLVQNGGPTLANLHVKENISTSGGGVAAIATSLAFAGSRFTGNYAWSGRGGAVWVGSASHASFTDCAFTANRASGGGGPVDAGAIFHEGGGAFEVVRSRFEGNVADLGATGGVFPTTGGAISSLADGARIVDSVFAGNRAHQGGALWFGGDTTVVNTVFSGNRAVRVPGGFLDGGGYGGAIVAFYTHSTIEGSTFAGNAADEDAGGVFVSTQTLLDVENTILWGNTGGAGQPLRQAQVHVADGGGAVTLRYDDLQGLFETIPGEDPPDPADSPGCLDDDPLYADANGADGVVGTLDDDVRLAAGSPAIDAGDNAAIPAGTALDLDGKPRRIDDPVAPDTGAGTAPLVDMGAYEVGTPPTECADLDGDGYGNPPATVCAHPEGDCDDSNAAVNPGALEVPRNGIDDDCDASTPGGCTPAVAEASLGARGEPAGAGLPVDLGLYVALALPFAVAMRRRTRVG